MTVLFVIFTILLFLAIDMVYRRIHERKTVPAGSSVKPEHVLRPYPLRTPEGIFFTKSHTWLNLFPSGKIQLGTDDFIGSMLENPQVALLKKAGDKIRKGDPLLALSENNRLLTIQSPIDGEVLASNDNLTLHPELLKTRLFSDGWAYSIRPSQMAELKNLLLGTESRNWMRQEFNRLRDFLVGAEVVAGNSPAYLHDGGAPVQGVLRHMDSEVWRNFEQEFLQAEKN